VFSAWISLSFFSLLAASSYGPTFPSATSFCSCCSDFLAPATGPAARLAAASYFGDNGAALASPPAGAAAALASAAAGAAAALAPAAAGAPGSSAGAGSA